MVFSVCALHHQISTCRRVRTERASSSFTSNLDDVVVPMDSLGEAFDRLANDNRVGSYVKAGARCVNSNLYTLMH